MNDRDDDFALDLPLDTVILAGGQNQRLNGVVPPYHKPFLVVNGESLLLRAVRHATDSCAQRIVVVTCAEIALPLVGLLEHSNVDLTNVHVITKTGGPGIALREGLELCRADRVLVLMADNWNQSSDITKICQHRYAVGVRDVPAHEAGQFTHMRDGHWIEDKVVLTGDKPTTVWCGPLLIDRSVGLSQLGVHDFLIGPHLNHLIPDDKILTLVTVSSSDLGTLEALQKFTSLNT